MAQCCTSVLLPAFAFQSRDADQIRETCRQQFGVDNASEFELFALVPLTQATLDQQLASQASSSSPEANNFEIGLRMNSPSFANLTLRNVENSMLEKQRCQNLLKSSNEALLTFTTELKRIKKVILAAVLNSEESMDFTSKNSETTGGAGSLSAANPKTAAAADPNAALAPQAGANQNMDALLKRLMKFKHLEDDNKKLKNLLKDQLEKSELLRQETQQTVETLREEFAELVEELVQYKNKEAAQMHPNSNIAHLQNTFGANDPSVAHHQQHNAPSGGLNQGGNAARK